ncbi:MAG: metallophosphoesterase family protein, partial [Tepidisphaeraceae bacterium]
MATRIETLSDDDLTRARASVAPLSRDIGSAKRDAGNGALVVAWLGDMHAHSTQDLAESTDTFRTHINSEANFELALTEVLALDPAPDVLVLGGDLTNWNTPAAYDVFRRILDRHWPARGAPPVLPIRGNHDQMLIKPDSLSFHSAWQRLRRPDFPEPADVGDGHYYDVSLGGWRFVAWDPGLNTLTELQRRWIRQRLAPERPSEPTVVLTHVPVLPCGNWVDRFALTDPAVLEALDACPHVKLVMSGHTHKSAAWRYRGKIHAIFPA